MNETILTAIGTGTAVIGSIYVFLRNFRNDMDDRFDKMDKKFDKKFELADKRYWEMEQKMDQRITETNKRMDGVYNILLKRTEK
jgi:uncharacterized membrane protein YgaE (UPF0421/DUF939 family)